MTKVVHVYDPLFARRRRLSTCTNPKPNARVIAHPWSRASTWSLTVLECLQCGRTSEPPPARATASPTSEKNEMA